jgi:hypothetical protein
MLLYGVSFFYNFVLWQHPTFNTELAIHALNQVHFCYCYSVFHASLHAWLPGSAPNFLFFIFYFIYLFGWDIYDSHRCPRKIIIYIFLKKNFFLIFFWGRAALTPQSSAGSSVRGTPNLL